MHESQERTEKRLRPGRLGQVLSDPGIQYGAPLQPGPATPRCRSYCDGCYALFETTVISEIAHLAMNT